MGSSVDLSDRCCGESNPGRDPARRLDPGSLPEAGGGRKGAAKLRADGFSGDIKLLTSCPSCLQGLSLTNPTPKSRPIVVVEMARHLLGETWLPTTSPRPTGRHRAVCFNASSASRAR